MAHLRGPDNLFFTVTFAAAKQIAAARVENYGMTLCDRELTSTDLEFLRRTSLENIVFDNVTDTTLFQIKDKSTNTSMIFSNRRPTRGELRGEILREKLVALQKQNPNQSIYQAIDSVISSGKTSDIYTVYHVDPTFFTSYQLTETTADYYLFKMIRDLKSGRVSDETDEETLPTLYQDLPIPFYEKLSILEEKIKDLENRCCEYSLYSSKHRELLSALQAATVLHKELIYAADQLPDKLLFKRICREAITTAKPILEKHRDGGWTEFFAALTVIVFSVASLGIANTISYMHTQSPIFLKPKTESSQIVEGLEEVIHKLS
jgi:hypothetical protein